MQTLLTFFLAVSYAFSQSINNVIPLQPPADDELEIPPSPFLNGTSAAGGRLLQGIANLHFTSTTRVIQTANGENLYATLLPAKQLHAILVHVRQDLVRNHKPGDTAEHYWFNYTDWAFEVIGTSDVPLHYAAIQAVVHRLLALLPDPPTEEMTFARVGRLYQDATPIADVAFLPLKPGIETDPTHAQQIALGAQADDPIITYVTPNGTIDVDPAMIDTSTLLNFINQTTPAEFPDLRRRQLAFADISRLLTNVAVGGFLVTFTFDVWHERSEARPQILLVSAPVLGAAVAAWSTSMAFEAQEKFRVDQQAQIAASTQLVEDYHVGSLRLRFLLNAHDAWEKSNHQVNPLQLGMALMEALYEHLKGLPIEQRVPTMQGSVYVELLDTGVPGQRSTVKVGGFNVTGETVPVDFYGD